MKRLLLALVFANVAFFGYTRLVGDTTPPPPPAQPIPRLVLLGETAPAPGLCRSVGPFLERSVLEQASTWLRSAHYESHERETVVDGPTDYVVTAAAQTLKQAEQTVMRLKAAGVSDLGVVAPNAERPTALIQLGLYTERANADKRVAELRRFAVSATISEQSHRVSAWWLDVPLAARQSSPDAAALTKALGVPDAVSVDACPGTPAAEPAAPAPAAAPNQPPSGAAPAKLSESSPA